MKTNVTVTIWHIRSITYFNAVRISRKAIQLCITSKLHRMVASSYKIQVKNFFQSFSIYFYTVFIVKVFIFNSSQNLLNKF